MLEEYPDVRLVPMTADDVADLQIEGPQKDSAKLSAEEEDAAINAPQQTSGVYLCYMCAVILLCIERSLASAARSRLLLPSCFCGSEMYVWITLVMSAKTHAAHTTTITIHHHPSCVFTNVPLQFLFLRLQAM